MLANPITSPSAGAADPGPPPAAKRGLIGLIGLIASLSLLTLGSMLASVAIAKLFGADGARHQLPLVLLGIGVLINAGCVVWLLQILQRSPSAANDCERYGRHMIGLTFLLLVLGLCNAVGTSTLALDGGLGFSASTVLEASNPEHEVNAEKERKKAVDAVKTTERNTATSERAQKRAQEEVDRACAPSVSDSDSAKTVCASAREQLAAAQEAFVVSKDLRSDASEALGTAQAKCTSLRANCKRALFFLLSLSTMMSLFGASFYVVNQVRTKRPQLITESPGDASLAMLNPAAPPSAGPSSVTGRDGQTTNEKPKENRSEPFDVHAFWSGAFFRVGEAVLFTFAFFWLIWTSDRRTEVVWLPVLGLFVGMFVKTGEAIIFRLGMRVLSAVEALLPSSASGARSEKATDGAETSRDVKGAGRAAAFEQ
jgi:hypothetical protein